MKLGTEKVICSPDCTRCEMYGENAWHLFVTCLVAIKTWKSIGLWKLSEPNVLTADGIFDSCY